MFFFGHSDGVATGQTCNVGIRRNELPDSVLLELQHWRVSRRAAVDERHCAVIEDEPARSAAHTDHHVILVS
jgi:hypothetical protein